MAKTAQKSIQNTLRNDLGHDLVVVNQKIDSVTAWLSSAQITK